MRSRKRGEVASVFLPSVPVLTLLANEMEVERDHALDRPTSGEDQTMQEIEEELAAANREERASNELNRGTFQALESDASFDRVLYDGGEFGLGAGVGSEEELDFLGIPGLLDAEQVGELLRQRQAKHLSKRKSTGQQQAAGVVDHRQLMDLRTQLAKSVAAYANKTGIPHGQIHNKLRAISGGPPVAQASEKQLRNRISVLQKWFVGQK